MDRFALIMTLAISLGALYSFIINKITKNKLILYFPSLAGGAYVIYIIGFYFPKSTGGLEDLGMVLVIFIIMAFIVGNLVSAFIFNRKKTRDR